jgi:hypothetical protein
MNNTIRTWKERIYQQDFLTEAIPSTNFTAEVELTDKALEAIYGATASTQTPNYICKPVTNTNNTPPSFLCTPLISSVSGSQSTNDTLDI